MYRGEIKGHGGRRVMEGCISITSEEEKVLFFGRNSLNYYE